MKRYSLTWWLAIVPTSVVVGGPVFLVLGYKTDWGTIEKVAVALIAAFIVDVVIAARMERIAPTKVRIGPGERRTNEEVATDKAIVIGGFDSSPHGQVSVRGERWAAVQCPEETDALSAGMVVRIVDRDGLSLVVSARDQ